MSDNKVITVNFEKRKGPTPDAIKCPICGSGTFHLYHDGNVQCGFEDCLMFLDFTVIEDD